MRARDLVCQVPTVEMDLPVSEAARLLADRCLPGLIVVDDCGSPVAVLPGAELLRLAVPAYIQESPIIARVIDEGCADMFLTEFAGRPMRQCMVDQRLELPVVGADATVVEIAVVMARTGYPLVAVADRPVGLLGAVTLESLLKRVFAS